MEADKCIRCEYFVKLNHQILDKYEEILKRMYKLEKQLAQAEKDVSFLEDLIKTVAPDSSAYRDYLKEDRK